MTECENCEYDVEMVLVERDRSTTTTAPPADKLIERGRTETRYILKDKVWLCPRCGEERKVLED